MLVCGSGTSFQYPFNFFYVVQSILTSTGATLTDPIGQFFGMAAAIDYKPPVQHVESLSMVNRTSSEPITTWKNLAEDANLATEDEHNTTFLQGVKLYPKACFWSALVTMTIVMDG